MNGSSAISNDQALQDASDRDYLAVSRFLYREAALLDEREYKAWLSLLADDLSYKVYVRLLREIASGPAEYAIIDDGLPAIQSRVAQLSQSPLTKAENPPSFTRRFITNVEVWGGTEAGTFVVHSNIQLHRVRGTAIAGTSYVGKRTDRITRTKTGFLLQARTVRLDQAIVFDGALALLL